MNHSIKLIEGVVLPPNIEEGQSGILGGAVFVFGGVKLYLSQIMETRLEDSPTTPAGSVLVYVKATTYEIRVETTPRAWQMISVHASVSIEVAHDGERRLTFKQKAAEASQYDAVSKRSCCGS